MSTSGIERLGFTKPISPKDKLSKKGSKKSSQTTGKVNDSLSISPGGKQISEMFRTLASVKGQLESNPKVAAKVHNDFNRSSVGDLFGSNTSDIETVLKGITKEITNNVNAAVKVHNNISVAEVSKFIS